MPRLEGNGGQASGAQGPCVVTKRERDSGSQQAGRGSLTPTRKPHPDIEKSRNVCADNQRPLSSGPGEDLGVWQRKEEDTEVISCDPLGPPEYSREILVQNHSLFPSAPVQGPWSPAGPRTGGQQGKLTGYNKRDQVEAGGSYATSGRKPAQAASLDVKEGWPSQHSVFMSSNLPQKVNETAEIHTFSFTVES